MNQEDKQYSEKLLEESLSALMDGENSELELRRIIRSLDEAPHLANTWQRYHLVKACLSREAHSNPSVNLLSGIQERMERDGLIGTPPVRENRFLARMLRLTGQGAIAASVAMMVLTGVTYLEVADNAEAGSSALIAQSDLPALGGDYTASDLTRVVRLDAAARSRLQQAVIQFSSSPGAQNNTVAGFPFEAFEPLLDTDTSPSGTEEALSGSQTTLP